MKIKDLTENAELDSLKWFPIDEPELPSYYPVRYAIMKAIGATDYANWGKIGTPWSDSMIGGGGTYMLRGPFGHVLLDASGDVQHKMVGLSQVSVEKTGTGLGNKIMNAIKNHADSRGFGVQVVKVTNREFFDKFDWLTPDKWKSTYTYDPSKSVNECSGYVAKKGQEKDPRFSMGLSVDVRPGEIERQLKKLGMLAESLYAINKEDPMRKSEVLVPGVGRYSIETLHNNLARKFADLAERLSKVDKHEAEQAQYLLTQTALPAMLDALAQAYKDLETKRRKGGSGSRGISK